MTAITKAPSDSSSQRRGLTITTARKSVTSGVHLPSPVRNTVKNVQQDTFEDKVDLISSQKAEKRQQARKAALPTVSSVSTDAIPGLRRQASALNPQEVKQKEKGWGLSFKDAKAVSPVCREVCVQSSALL